MSSDRPIALEDRNMENGRLFSPSAARNLSPIMSAFVDFGLTRGRVLEVGSGTGEHAAHLVKAHPELQWVASDPDHGSRASCAAWADHFQIADRMSAHHIDARETGDIGQHGPFDLIYSSNVIHISPIEVMKSVFALAGEHLQPTGQLAFYGPFSRNGEHNSDGNANFDVSLKSRNPEWGVRDIEHHLMPEAEKSRLVLRELRDMPANNYFLVFKRVG